MTLERAHRILIGTAIVFFLFYGVWEITGHGGRGSIARGVAAFVAAVLGGAYHRTIGREAKPPRPPAGDRP